AGRALLLGEQNEPLALARVGYGRDRGKRIRPQLRRQRPDRGKRDHFAADLGESPGAALDGDEALLVDGDDIAGVMPAFRRRLEHAWIFDLEIAEHHVRSAHVEAAAFPDSLDPLQARLPAGQDAP